MAFWELSLISKQLPARRQAIYTDIERPDGSTWSQILDVSLSELGAVTTRIKAFTDPPLLKEAIPPTSLNPEIPVEIRPTKPEDIYVSPEDESVSQFVKYIGANPNAKIPPIQLVKYGAKRVVDEKFVSRKSGQLRVKLESLLSKFLQLKLAMPFQEKFSQRATAVVCGYPSSRASIIVDAISSASNFAVHSISEDTPGQVQKDVGKLARTLVDLQIAIQKFVGFTLQPHWTDAQFRDTDRRKVTEVNEIMDALKGGVHGILETFESYLTDVGISATEAKAWKRLVEND